MNRLIPSFVRTGVRTGVLMGVRFTALVPVVAFVVAASGLLSACGGGAGAGGAGGTADALAPASSAVAQIDARVTQAFASASIAGMSVRIMDRNDQVVYNKRLGTFTEDQRIAVASASKLVSAMVIFRLIEQNQLSLESTTGQMLGWTGPKADITVRHLLSFTSGLEPEAACTANPALTLQECAATLADRAALALPATRFDYGGAHMQVLGAMAEKATGKSWNAIFQEQLAAPMQLSTQARYSTFPRAESGSTNPLVAGGLKLSTAEYVNLLRLAFHKGTTGGRSLISAARFDQQGVEPYPAVTIGKSPMADAGLPFRYGLGAWLECATPAAGCSAISSPGAFGFTPWLDRNVGYYAVIAMEAGDTDSGVSRFSVRLAQDLKPLIAQALR